MCSNADQNMGLLPGIKDIVLQLRSFYFFSTAKKVNKKMPPLKESLRQNALYTQNQQSLFPLLLKRGPVAVIFLAPFSVRGNQKNLNE
jgi:hypothetical protein